MVPRVGALDLRWVEKYETVSPLVTYPAVLMLVHHHLPLPWLAKHFSLVSIKSDKIARPLRFLDTDYSFGLV